MHIINLDANASLPPTEAARLALIQSLDLCANPSSPHQLGRRLRTHLDLARSQVAKALGGKDQDVFFTSGASEGNRWLVDSVLSTGKLSVWSTALEHPSLAKPLRSCSWAPSIEAADVVFATAAHNETGLITDWEPILAQINPDAILVSDVSQSLGRIGSVPDRVDAMVCSGHKIGAYPGVGAILLRNRAKRLKAPWTGGGQEGNLRPGTEASQLIIAFGAAADEIELIRSKNQDLKPLRDRLEGLLLQAWPMARRIPETGARLPNTSALALSRVNGDALRILVDQTGVCVGFGSACSALAPEPSPALLSLGLTREEARATIRLSLCPNTTELEIREAAKRLIALKI
ncbi:MAG: aminotransferase class V-fold PLP-dependent enzyme [Myxococcaceae bacterium]|nr:aminotransferase class V-fold PLP-dependent enzyme [Myxococcaceae bacterium]MBH2006537.1 aminotransferase class V-fold PLP-dependent enzyme [Myxococcaceae bacterium]